MCKNDIRLGGTLRVRRLGLGAFDLGRRLMNHPHKFSKEFGSDHALDQRTAIVSHHDTIKWFEAIPGEQLCIRVHGTQVNGRYAIMENIAAPGTATPMHFHAEDERG